MCQMCGEFRTFRSNGAIDTVPAGRPAGSVPCGRRQFTMLDEIQRTGTFQRKEDKNGIHIHGTDTTCVIGTLRSTDWHSDG